MTFVKDGFDLLYREGRTRPQVMSLGLHLRLIGHPSRAAGRERVLDYMAGHSVVAFLVSDGASYVTGQTLSADGGHWMLG